MILSLSTANITLLCGIENASSWTVFHGEEAALHTDWSGQGKGKDVDNILLDTGCSRALVHHSMVSEEKIQEGSAVAIQCAHENVVLYPLANISLEVEGHLITVEATVASNLSVSLGTDNPELPKLLEKGESGGEELAFSVTTRVESRRQKGKDEGKARQARECGVQPNSLDRMMILHLGWRNWMKRCLAKQRQRRRGAGYDGKKARLVKKRNWS